MTVSLRSGPLRACLDEALEPHWIAGRLRDPDRSMAPGITLKDDAAAHVVRCRLADLDLVIKRERHPGVLRRWRRQLRTSRARRAWAAAHKLRAAGIACVEPLGWIERRRGPWVQADWLLTRYVEGSGAVEAVAERAGDPLRLARLLDALAALLLDLERQGWAHGDLKASNVRVGADDLPVLLDLHALGRPPWFLRSRRLARDRARLLRNWADDAVTMRALLRRLDRGRQPS